MFSGKRLGNRNPLDKEKKLSQYQFFLQEKIGFSNRFQFLPFSSNVPYQVIFIKNGNFLHFFVFDKKKRIWLHDYKEAFNMKGEFWGRSMQHKNCVGCNPAARHEMQHMVKQLQ